MATIKITPLPGALAVFGDVVMKVRNNEAVQCGTKPIVILKINLKVELK